MSLVAKRKQFELIQAVRGLAAVMVVYVHTEHAPSVGCFGVDLFFVLSGAVMAMLMDERPLPGAFLRQRLVRIVPLYFAMTTVAASVYWLWPQLRSSGDIPSVLDYVRSLAFIPYATPSGSLVPVLSPGWTLNYEMFFYLGCACALYLARDNPHIFAIALVVILSVAAQVSSNQSDIVRFAANPIIFEFLIGVATWRIHSALPQARRPKLALAGLGLSLVAITVAELAFPMSASDPITWRRPLLFGLLAAGVIYFALRGEAAYSLTHHRAAQLLRQVGDASYAIYLTHLFVIGLFKLCSARLGFIQVHSSLGAALAVVTAIALGVAVHRWFDWPLQRWLRSAIGP